MTKVKQSDIQRAELGNSVVRVANPEGGAAFLSGTGAIKIVMPQNASMTRFVVDLFLYTGDDRSGVTLLLGGRPVLDSWYRTFTQIIGSSAEANLKVRFGYDGASPCIWIGEVTDNVSNIAVVVRDFVAIQSNTVKEWGTGWSVSLATSLGTIISTKTNNLVYCSESQITGTSRTFTEVQTFGNSPIVPTATEDTHAVNLGQVRNLVGNKKSPLTNVSGATNLDVSEYGVFDLTLTAAADFTFINIPTDSTRPVTIYLTGAFAWTLAQGTEEVSSDAYAGAADNRIQVDIVSPTKIFYQIQNL